MSSLNSDKKWAYHSLYPYDCLSLSMAYDEVLLLKNPIYRHNNTKNTILNENWLSLDLFLCFFFSKKFLISWRLHPCKYWTLSCRHRLSKFIGSPERAKWGGIVSVIKHFPQIFVFLIISVCQCLLTRTVVSYHCFPSLI